MDYYVLISTFLTLKRSVIKHVFKLCVSLKPIRLWQTIQRLVRFATSVSKRFDISTVIGC